MSLYITVNGCFPISFPLFFPLHVEMRMMCRCSPCQTSGWWCWRSPSPTCPLTPCALRRTEMTLMPLSCLSPFQTLCPMPAPGSHYRYALVDVEPHTRNMSVLDFSLSCWYHLFDKPDWMQMRCQANKNGSQVECDLGNPLKRNAKVRELCEVSQSPEEIISYSLIPFDISCVKQNRYNLPLAT